MWWVFGIKILSISIFFFYIYLLRINFICFRVYFVVLYKREKFCFYKGRRRSLWKYFIWIGNKFFIIYVKIVKWIIKIFIFDFFKEILFFNMFFFFSVYDIVYNLFDLFVVFFIIWLWRGSVFYFYWIERGWWVGEIIFLFMIIMNWSFR